jgi:hypothetical protein
MAIGTSANRVKRPPGSGAPQSKVRTALFTTVPCHIIHQAKMRYASCSRTSSRHPHLFLSFSAHPSSHGAQLQHGAASPRLVHSFSPRPPSHIISHLCSIYIQGAHTQTLCGSMSPYLFFRIIRRAVPGVRCMWSHFSFSMQGYQRVAPPITGATAV